ncbi:hypothetical protein HX794_21865 [Pseudomonas costantinii]|uniref:hypothetical protein n=1 Tax=Pseudomonas costantinii TaxID=168469 RepID=UPI00159FEA89|nr:hypothetical protein [Pseudomonas costantinii]NVZ22294.1 hypothetical protein [Pseudomonas costantinii]
MSNSIRGFTVLALLLCVLIVIAAAVGGVVWFSPVPYWDMWDGYLDFYAKVAAGNYSAWWAPHNEHRIVLSRLFFWSDIRWFGGLSYSLIVINYLLASVTCLVFVRFVIEAFNELPNKDYRNFFIFLVVAWLFSWCQQENFTVGFQSQFFMAQLLPLCAFYFIYKSSAFPEKASKYFLLASFFGVLSVGTMANGIIALPLLLVYGVFCKIGVRKNAVLLALAVICIGFYLNNLPPKQSSLVDTVVHNPLGFVHYVLLYIGSPFYYITPILGSSARVVVAALAGLFFVVLVSCIAYSNIRAPQKNYRHLSLLLFILYFGGTALGTAGGRLMLGVEQALSGRYTTPALMAWAALLVLMMPVLVRWVEKRKIVLAAFIVLLMALLMGQSRGLESQEDEHLERLAAALSLELNVKDKNQIVHVYPSVERALDVTQYASENHLSIFGVHPILGTKEKIGSSNTLTAETQCKGSLDKVVPIAGEERFAAVNGWIFDSRTESVPRSALIVDQKNMVVGYALTGGNRKNVAQLNGPKALHSKFKGYVLKDSLGTPLKVISDDAGCYFDVVSRPVLYNFDVVSADVNATSLTVSDVLRGAEWTGSDSWHSTLDGLKVFGSWRQSDADTGSIVLRVKRGDKLLYRSGPTSGRQFIEFNDDPSSVSTLPVATEWGVLDFSNSKFPESFSIKISDDGDAWGEWSAIALKTEHN